MNYDERSELLQQVVHTGINMMNEHATDGKISTNTWYEWMNRVNLLDANIRRYGRSGQTLEVATDAGLNLIESAVGASAGG
jgi:hypothetical protein